MGYTNSELLEEIMILSYEEGIIEKVREEVTKLLEKNKNIPLYEAYDLAYQKFSKKSSKKFGF